MSLFLEATFVSQDGKKVLGVCQATGAPGKQQVFKLSAMPGDSLPMVALPTSFAVSELLAHVPMVPLARFGTLKADVQTFPQMPWRSCGLGRHSEPLFPGACSPPPLFTPCSFKTSVLASPAPNPRQSKAHDATIIPGGRADTPSQADRRK